MEPDDGDLIRRRNVPVMLLHGVVLDRGSRISLRRQLVGHLESRILGGQIGPGRRLPSVRRVEELLGLHRNTVAAAYRDLVQAGLARTRPGSGVYVRLPSGSRGPAAARVTIQGSRDVGIECSDEDLKTALAAELRARLAVRVSPVCGEAPSVRLRLMPGDAFLRGIESLPRPSLVSGISRSDRVHRLIANAVLIHGGEGIAYLPAVPGNRDQLVRATRLARLTVADYEVLPWARNRLNGAVVPLPLVSACSWTELTLHLERAGWSRARRDRSRKSAERSMQPSVEVP